MRALILMAICLLAAPLVASAQYANLSYSRPSQGPSARVGQIGGIATRASVTSLRDRSVQPLERHVDSRFLRSRPGGPVPAASMAPAFLPIAPTLSRDPGRFDATYIAANGGVEPGRLARLSDMGRFYSNSAPILDEPGPEILVTGILYEPDPDPRGAFEQYFDLQSRARPPVGPLDPVAENYVDILEANSLRRIDQARERAVVTFRLATAAEDSPERRERLAEAADRLRGALRLQPEDPTAHVLLAHAALEREHVLSAALALMDLTAVQPDYFSSEPTDVREYYGDAARVDALARRYLFIRSESSGDARTFVVQAYCAWLAGDWARVKAAVSQIDTLNRLAEPPDPQLARFAGALSAAGQAVE